ncbi:SPOR domain-containing protein [Cryomorphaceae bacterium 1068]|nr:SPOR domain-containing protein [Cryomorphaceae bacterium 1068]
MSKSIFLLILSSLACISTSQGQDEDAQLKERVYSRDYRTSKDSSAQNNLPGTITVIEDERITELDNLKKEYPGLQDGYRVQIFFGKRKEALDQKAKFAQSHPELPAYISYLAPNFRLRVGDFRSRTEGEKFKQEIDSEYQGCYLVKDKIELPSLEKDESKEAEDSKKD